MQIEVAQIIIKVVYSRMKKRINKIIKSGFISKGWFYLLFTNPPLEREIT